MSRNLNVGPRTVFAAAGACLAIGVLAVGCKSAGAQIATKIADKVKSQGIQTSKVVCDKSTAHKGEKFGCTATTTDGTQIHYNVVMTADDRFDANTVGPVFLKAGLEQLLAEEGKKVTGLDATVSCGPKVLYTKEQIPSTQCTGTMSGVSVPLTVKMDGDTPLGLPAKPLLVKAQAEDQLSKALQDKIGDPKVSVDCGSAAVKVLDQTGGFTCEAKASDGSAASVSAQMGADGSITLVSTTPH
jgi:hypothetical protein